MESLELPRLLLHHSRTKLSAAPTQAHHSSRYITQLSFPFKLKKATTNAQLRSLPSDAEGGAAASQDRPFAFQDETNHRDEERPLLLARDTDAFGSLVGFRLLHHLGAFLFHITFLTSPFC